MSLDKDFKSFCDQKKSANNISSWQKNIFAVKSFIIANRTKVDIGVEIAKSLTAFAVHKTPFTLVEGALSSLKTYLYDYSDSGDFFSENRGWKALNGSGMMSFSGMFTSILKKYPSQSLKFEYDKSPSKIIDLPCGQIGYIQVPSEEFIYYKHFEMDAEVVINFLIEEKLKELGTNIISIDFNPKGDHPGINLIPEVIFPIQSEKANQYTNYIKKCLDKGINRSIILNGSPGVGKSTLSQTIIQNLGYRTLKFRYNEGYSFNLFTFIIRKFKIEAVVIDDFDQISGRDELFEFLEVLKKETKLVIGLVNSLHEFHPALIRPGRFDEIIMIDALEPDVVKDLLGKELAEKYFMKVKNWPVAYINEFVIRSKILDAKELGASFKELDARVKKALEGIK